ncbi:aromatic amino acid transport family protein [Luteococcus peritonei]|uniref:Aromatic amino acid transport family protein n=1 Tax=Luteococcus peritonei TaxID=88874 RepID=A0ABW4RTT5_9ACTN
MPSPATAPLPREASRPPSTPTEAAAGTATGTDRAFNRAWVISLFGTAIGAGILFLPINAGSGGIWPLLVVTLLIGPMTYLSHRALSRMICSAPRATDDITCVVRDYFGENAGRLVTVLYFCAIYPIVLIYGVGITNTVESALTNQLHVAAPPRWLLSFVLIALLMSVMLAGQSIMLKITGLLVYPLILVLLGVTLYLIPSWQFDIFTQAGTGSPRQFLMAVWLMIPTLVFAFNHSPAISQFSLSLKSHYGQRSAEEASRILRSTTVLLVLFAMTFVWSCVLALGQDGLAEARAANLPVLSYLANVHDAPFISYLGPVVAVLAIGSSFFGHYLGAAEGLCGIIRFADPDAKRLSQRTLSLAVAAFIFVTSWLVAIINPSILSLIESLAGPVIAAVLYLMPMYAIHKVEALRPYRGRASNVFVTIAGIVAVGGILVGLVR